MKITYYGCPALTRPYENLIGLTFEKPDDDRVSFGTYLFHEGKNYSVLWCECAVIYDNETLNQKHRIVVPNVN